MPFDFGFSVVGAIFLAGLYVPNVLWTRCRPARWETYAKRENRVLLVLERIGEVLVTVFALIFRDPDLLPFSPWSLWLAAAAACVLLYEINWVRYFRSERTMRDFYRPLWGIPLPGATLPVAAFGLLAVYGKNPFLAAAVAVFAVGHVGIHAGHRRELLREEREQKGNGASG